MRGFCTSLKQGALVAFLVSTSVSVFSQTRTLTAHPDAVIPSTTPYGTLARGYYESLPASYNSTTGKYPVIITFHGNGARGNGSSSQLSQVLGEGVMLEVASGRLPETFTVNGKTFSFIYFAPQYSGDANPYPGYGTGKSVIDFVLANYPRADPNRIYVTGLSAGGAITWYAAGATQADAQRLAAIVTMEGAGGFEGWPQNVGRANLPMWAIVNSGDGNYPDLTNSWVDGANSVIPAPNPLAKKTVLISGSHDSWSNSVKTSFTGDDGKNIYEWMLTYSRGEDVVLPVALGTYNVFATTSGTSTSQKVTVAWTTTHEQNNSFFTISRSVDGINFTPVGKLPAATQGQGNSYTFTDPGPLSGTSYYRLSQTDADGTTKSFDVKSVTIDNLPGEDMAKAYPNPATNQVVLEMNNKFSGRLNATIINAEGKVLFAKVFSKPNGFMREVINIGSLAKGLYMLKVEGDGYTSTLRFIKE